MLRPWSQTLRPPAIRVRLEGSYLFWHEPFVMLTLLSAYEGTGDTQYLKKLMAEIDHVLRLRDDRQGIRDEVRGRVMPAWSTDFPEAAGGRRYCRVVHAADLTFPIARCAHLIHQSPTLSEVYDDKAKYYLQQVIETVEAFESNWREGPQAGQGYYGEFALYGDVLYPYKGSTAMGQVHLALYQITGDVSYRQRVEKIARYFQGGLGNRGGRYVWAYSPAMPRVEDIGHGGASVDFAVRCCRTGIVFDEQDMKRFVGTFFHMVRPQGFAHYVDGSGEPSPPSVASRWGLLAQYDWTVAEVLMDYFREVPPALPLRPALLLEVAPNADWD